MTEPNPSPRRFLSRQFQTVLFIIVLLTIVGLLLIPTMDDVFPNNGGYTRNILFIKPSGTGDPGYFVIIDEINPTKDNIPVDWLLHGRGDLTIFNLNQSAIWTVESYLNASEIVRLHTIFIEPEVTISESTGPFYPDQTTKDNPIQLSYIKARPTQTGSTRFLTLLFPLNSSMSLPNITTTNGVTYIGNDNLILSQSSSNLRNFENFTTDGEILFLRLNKTDISSFVLQKGQILKDQNRTYVSSSQPISMNLEYESSNISGKIWIHTPTNFSLWVPKEPKQTTFNGKDIIVYYNSATQMMSFTVVRNGSLFIAHDPSMFMAPSPSDEIPPLPTKASIPLKAYGSHPYLYFNTTTLPALRTRALSEQPWQGWYLSVLSSATSHLADVVSSMSALVRYAPTLNLAFSGVLSQNLTHINKAKEFLQKMDEIVNYNSHLDRAIACSHYALAYDMLYQNLSIAERVEIAGKLENHTIPLIEKFPYLSHNNHIGIVASGIGLVGLAIDKSDWVALGISGIDTYFATCFTDDGGNFEGYSYSGYFFETGLKFFYGLNNLGEKNYFSDSKFLSFINSTLHSFSPLSSNTLFEDCTTNPQIIEDLLWTTSAIYPYAPLLSNYTQWVYDQRILNDALVYDGFYLQSSISSISSMVNRICMYSMNITPVQPPLEPILVLPEVGLAYMRSDWGREALYLSITCKRNALSQYHSHYDENSFELWAYGAWLVANPGYPGYGVGEYDRIIQTEASNTILMNNQGQQRVNGDGFQEYFSSNEVDGLVASANSLYTSPGNYGVDPYFLGVILFIFANLGVACSILLYLRWKALRTNVNIVPQVERPSYSAIKFQNLTLKTHLIIVFGVIFGVIISLLYFFLYTNPYVNIYIVGKHGEIATLIPIIEIVILMISIPLLLFIITLKSKIQKKLLRQFATLSTNLPKGQIPSLDDSVKLTYLPQVFFLIIFIPLMILLYVPPLQNIVGHIFNEAGSLMDSLNYIITSLDHWILLFTLTLLLYLPFKAIGIYMGGRHTSNKLVLTPSKGILMHTASYLITLTFMVLLITFLTLGFFYVFQIIGGPSFVVS